MSPREKRELREAASELRIELALLKGKLARLGLENTAVSMVSVLSTLRNETKNKTGGEL